MDIQPNATINHWIAGILLFTFNLVHIPTSKPHQNTLVQTDFPGDPLQKKTLRRTTI
ncbi:hypothetical protein JAAARDRAFT_31112 [Jaapia argillacea MUCL 33604]|uniref:Uncharacterized protein n=1 Tax=Jaapia argillacea MUCL 33604 TaxID=933084 RepID=A0A067Q3K4_9AGAM|nr:hypothetical protein JAAARDRAFT_31112 [Jaapia argillacea MUCL 33604]